MGLSKIWVLAESFEGKVSGPTLELLTKARELGDTVEAVYGGADDELVAVDPQVGAVGEHRAVELHRQPSDRVTTVVALREEHRVGRVLADERRQRGGAHDAGQRVAGVDREHLGRAVLAETGGQRVGVGADVHGLDGVGQLAGLGEDLEGRARRLVTVGFGEDPDLGNCHLSFSCYFSIRGGVRRL